MMMNKKRSMGIILIISLLLAGCATTHDKYSNNNDYHEIFDVDAKTAFNTTIAVLEALNWKIKQQTRYEDMSDELKNAYEGYRIYYGWTETDIKEGFYLLVATNVSLKAFVKPVSDTQTDIIIRYSKLAAVGPFYDAPGEYYRNDKYVEKIYEKIAKFLERNIL